MPQWSPSVRGIRKSLAQKEDSGRPPGRSIYLTSLYLLGHLRPGSHRYRISLERPKIPPPHFLYVTGQMLFRQMGAREPAGILHRPIHYLATGAPGIFIPWNDDARGQDRRFSMEVVRPFLDQERPGLERRERFVLYLVRVTEP